MNFGIMYAGCMLAVEAELLPFDEKVVHKALRRCFRAAVAELRDPEADLRQWLGELADKLSELRPSPSTGSMKAARLGDGWRSEDKRVKRFVVRSESFQFWFPKLLQRRNVLEWLDSKGYLGHEKRFVSKNRTAIDWAQRQVTWPDGSRPRSIEIRLPDGVRDLRI